MAETADARRTSKRLDGDAWAAARQLWESDPSQTFAAVAGRMSVSRAAVSKRASKEGWSRPSGLGSVKIKSALIERNAKSKPTEVDGTVEKRVTSPAQIRTAVVVRHRRDWMTHRTLFTLERIAEDFEAGKQAKISAEMLLLRQRGEREAYGIEGHAGGGVSDGLPLVTVKDLTGRKYNGPGGS